jgi:starch synthase
MMRILFVSSEVFPYAKTGGLADVAHSLPKSLYQLGHEVRVIMPLYRGVARLQAQLTPIIDQLQVPLGEDMISCSIYQSRLDRGIPIYFVKQDDFFDREGLYRDADGDYLDNAPRFIFFCRAVLEAMKRLDFRPHVVHTNDWQTALIPVYLRTLYGEDPFYRTAATVFTIHNIGYQGIFWHYDMHLIGLGWEHFTIDTLEFYGKVNLLKGGIVFADIVTTVSPTYAAEIQTPEFGYGLEQVLRMKRACLFGVQNGIDTETWSPKNDPWLAGTFDHDDLSGKHICKDDLLKRVGLDSQPDAPVLSLISRLDHHKGISLFEQIEEQLLHKDLKLLVLGTGDLRYHRFFEGLQAKYPAKVRVFLGFDEVMAHRIIAGSDFLLMPSLSEPSGLSHLHGMAYGTIPVVRRTGGLADTVQDYSESASDSSGVGTGFRFDDFSGEAFLGAIERALTLYRDSSPLVALRKNCMSQDFSWRKSAQTYLDLYTTAKKVCHGPNSQG